MKEWNESSISALELLPGTTTRGRSEVARMSDCSRVWGMELLSVGGGEMSEED